VLRGSSRAPRVESRQPCCGIEVTPSGGGAQSTTSIQRGLSTASLRGRGRAGRAPRAGSAGGRGGVRPPSVRPSVRVHRPAGPPLHAACAQPPHTTTTSAHRSESLPSPPGGKDFGRPLTGRSSAAPPYGVVRLSEPAGLRQEPAASWPLCVPDHPARVWDPAAESVVSDRHVLRLLPHSPGGQGRRLGPPRLMIRLDWCLDCTARQPESRRIHLERLYVVACVGSPRSDTAGAPTSDCSMRRRRASSARCRFRSWTLTFSVRHLLTGTYAMGRVSSLSMPTFGHA